MNRCQCHERVICRFDLQNCKSSGISSSFQRLRVHPHSLAFCRDTTRGGCKFGGIADVIGRGTPKPRSNAGVGVRVNSGREDHKSRIIFTALFLELSETSPKRSLDRMISVCSAACPLMLAALLLGVMVTPAIAGLNLDSLINKAVKKLPVKPGTGQSVSMSDPSPDPPPSPCPRAPTALPEVRLPLPSHRGAHGAQTSIGWQHEAEV